MGAFVEGELHLVMDANVSKPTNCHFYFFFLLLAFFLHPARKELMVTALAWQPASGSFTHKHFTKMRTLARDETPFLLAMQPRATTLAW
jgi:hypothetical protein